MVKIGSNPNIKVNTGLCPHGLPVSACPICSGKGGGGGVGFSSNKSTKINPNEWSYAKCYAYGQMLKRQRLEKEMNQLEYLAHQLQQKQFIKKIQIMIEKFNYLINDFTQSLKQTANNIFIKIIPKAIIKSPQMIKNFITNSLNFITNSLKIFKSLIKEASNRLNAILGSIKNFWDNKVTSYVQNIKKKLFSFFFTKEANEDNRNNQVIEDEKLRKRLEKVLKKFLNKKEKRNE